MVLRVQALVSKSLNPNLQLCKMRRVIGCLLLCFEDQVRLYKKFGTVYGLVFNK